MDELNGTEFVELMHEAYQTEFANMDPERAATAQQLGLLFAHNPEFANYAALVDYITLTPADTPGEPPQATLRLVVRGQVFTFETNEEGKLVQTAYSQASEEQ